MDVVLFLAWLFEQPGRFPKAKTTARHLALDASTSGDLALPVGHRTAVALFSSCKPASIPETTGCDNELPAPKEYSECNDATDSTGECS